MIWVGFATGSGSISSKVSWIRIRKNYTDPDAKPWSQGIISLICLQACYRTSSVTSFPKSPQNNLKINSIYHVDWYRKDQFTKIIRHLFPYF